MLKLKFYIIVVINCLYQYKQFQMQQEILKGVSPIREIQNEKKLEYDFLVIGGGTMGLSTALYLSLEYPDSKTALIEQYEIGHKEGGSHSETRVIRSTYDFEFYRDLCIQCKQNYWPKIEQILGQQLVFPNPYLAYIEQDTKVYKNYKRSASTSKTIKEIPVEEAERIFPHIPKIKACKSVFYEEGAGLIMSANYMASVCKYLKEKTKVDVYENCEVQSIKNDEKGSIVCANSKEYSYIFKGGKVALCCGRWINKMAPVTEDIVKNIKQVVTYWKMKNPSNYPIGQYPIFVHVQKNNDYNYILPDGRDGDIKYMMYIEDERYHNKNFENDEEFVKASLEYMRKKMMEYHYVDEALDITCVQTCWYSLTKQDHFLIDWTDEHKNVLIVSACSGHGFKFSPIIGKIVTDRLCKDKSIDIYEKYRSYTSLPYHIEVSQSGEVKWK